MELWQISLKKFLGDYPVVDDDPVGPDSLTLKEKEIYLMKEIKHDGKNWVKTSLKHFKDRFYIAKVIPDDLPYNGDIVVLYKQKDGEFIIIGGYIGPSLWVSDHPKFRRKGIGTQLVIEKYYRSRGDMSPMSYTTKGLRTHISAHRKEVYEAIKRAERIPPGVLLEYRNFKHQ